MRRTMLCCLTVRLRFSLVDSRFSSVNQLSHYVTGPHTDLRRRVVSRFSLVDFRFSLVR
jgi:hypothetical protein